MTPEEAITLLKRDGFEFRADGSLTGTGDYASWSPKGFRKWDHNHITLDGDFTADQLEAMAVYIRYAENTGENP